MIHVLDKDKGYTLDGNGLMLLKNYMTIMTIIMMIMMMIMMMIIMMMMISVRSLV